jgi:hypothetical protein
MKIKIILASSILLLINAYTAIAQQYESCFGEESTKWVIVKPNSNWGFEHEYSPNYYNFDSIKYYGWYNQDTKAGHLMFHENNNAELWRWEPKTGKKDLMMNLNWQVGDTVFIDQNALREWPDEMPFTIVDSIYFDEQERKVIHTELALRIDTMHFNLEYIEGVGPNASIFLLEDYGFFWDSSNLLLCVYKDEVRTYSNIHVSTDCTYPKPVSNKKIEDKKEIDFVFSNNIITIISQERFLGKLCIVATNGKEVKNEEINQQKQSFNINNLHNGIYIYQITDHSKKMVLSGKISKY